MFSLSSRIPPHNCFILRFTIFEMLSASFIDIAPDAKSFIAFAWIDFRAFFFWVFVLYTQPPQASATTWACILKSTAMFREPE